MSLPRILMALAVVTLTGCASPHARNPSDPLESFNRGVYQFNDAVDKTIAKPVAQGYNAVMPVPGKIMVSNFFSNLDDFLVTLNDLLQLKFTQAASDGARFLFNSTFGVFGLYADSQPSRISRINHVRSRNQLYLTKVVNRRAQLLDQEKVLDEAAIDRYAFIRDAYLLRRQSLVHDGNPPREKYEDEEEENGFEYRQTPVPRPSSSRQNNVPAVSPSDMRQAAAVADTSQETASRPNIHKVWIAQRTGIR